LFDPAARQLGISNMKIDRVLVDFRIGIWGLDRGAGCGRIGIRILTVGGRFSNWNTHFLTDWCVGVGFGFAAMGREVVAFKRELPPWAQALRDGGRAGVSGQASMTVSWGGSGGGTEMGLRRPTPGRPTV